MSLLTTLRRDPAPSDRPTIEYDPSSQANRVLEFGEWVESWRARSLRGTKMTDPETGEDSKGE
jgi:hypothetical protein